jgi:hypothetical protein
MLPDQSPPYHTVYSTYYSITATTTNAGKLNSPVSGSELQARMVFAFCIGAQRPEVRALALRARQLPPTPNIEEL